MDTTIATQTASDFLEHIFVQELHTVPNDKNLWQCASEKDWVGVIKRLMVIRDSEHDHEHGDPRSRPSYLAGEILCRVKAVYLLSVKAELAKQGDVFASI